MLISMMPPLNNRLQISAASLMISDELLPARFPPMRISSRSTSARTLLGQVIRPLSRPLPVAQKVSSDSSSSSLVGFGGVVFLGFDGGIGNSG